MTATENRQSSGSQFRYRAGKSPYKTWQEQEGIPEYRGSYVSDLYRLDLAPWPRIGQAGAFVNLGGQEQDDGWVIEIAPRGQTEVLHHAFEAMIFVLDGHGATTFWQSGAPKQTVEWQRGSLFAPPLNCYYQHFNTHGQEPARLFAVTSAPTMINLVRDTGFVFNNPYVLADRYNGEEDYFKNSGRFEGRIWQTNFVPDVRKFTLHEAGGNRGMGVRMMPFVLANNSMDCHISQWPSGTYKKAHCHVVGAHVTILEGQGYTLLWSEGQPRQRVDWKDGTVLAPRDGEYHQHFNTGPAPCSFLALKAGETDVSRGQERLRYNPEYHIDSPEYDGGIPFEAEDPEIYEIWAEECRKNGAEPILPRPDYVHR